METSLKIIFTLLLITLVCLSLNAMAATNCISFYKENPKNWETQANTYLNTKYPEFVDLIIEVNDEELSKEVSMVVAELCLYHSAHGETLEQVLERTVRGITPRAQAFLDYGPELVTE